MAVKKFINFGKGKQDHSFPIMNDKSPGSSCISRLHSAFGPSLLSLCMAVLLGHSNYLPQFVFICQPDQNALPCAFDKEVKFDRSQKRALQCCIYNLPLNSQILRVQHSFTHLASHASTAILLAS